jgi:methionine synthase II (cobalamin-independent)
VNLIFLRERSADSNGKVTSVCSSTAHSRNDVKEFSGEKLDGFAFTKNRWMPCHGSRPNAARCPTPLRSTAFQHGEI